MSKIRLLFIYKLFGTRRPINSNAPQGSANIQYLTQFSVSLLFLPAIANGYPCFVIAISMIGVCTAVIGDVASHLGCFIFLKDTVNAIAFVALGTSVPGL